VGAASTVAVSVSSDWMTKSIETASTILETQLERFRDLVMVALSLYGDEEEEEEVYLHCRLFPPSFLS